MPLPVQPFGHCYDSASQNFCTSGQKTSISLYFIER